MASGIGTTHISPGWIQVLNESPGASLESWIGAHPEHPYALGGVDALTGGLAALREVCARTGLNYVSDEDLTGFVKPVRSGVQLPAADGAWVRLSRRRSCRKALRPVTCASPAPC